MRPRNALFQVHIRFIHWGSAFKVSAQICFAFLNVVSVYVRSEVFRSNAVLVANDINIIVAFKFIKQLGVMRGKNQRSTIGIDFLSI